MIGPKRSGTTIHKEPLETSSWTTIIKGRKKWVLFPPDTSEKVSRRRRRRRSNSIHLLFIPFPPLLSRW